MPQSDYAVENEGSSDVRSELNDIFSSISTNNSGATEPNTTFPYQWFYNTDTKTLNIRNATNNAWIIIATFDQTANTWSPTAESGTFTNTLTALSFNGGHSVSVPGGWVSNMGLTYSSSVLSVAGYEGTALSSANPAYVTMRDSAAPGLLKTYTVTANQGFIDGTGASEIPNNLFGLTASIDTSVDIPFYTYAVSNTAQTNVAVMMSRVPGMINAPIATEIGQPGDAIADEQFSFFSFETIDESLYAGNPCVMISSHRMRFISDDWEVSALGDNDGIGMFQQGIEFLLPISQFGSATGKYFKDNGFTAPGFSSNDPYYKIDPFNRECMLLYSYSGNNVAGVGAVSAQAAIPFEPSRLMISMAGMYSDSSTGIVDSLQASIPPGGTSIFMHRSGFSSDLDNEDIDSGDAIRIVVSFPIEIE